MKNRIKKMLKKIYWGFNFQYSYKLNGQKLKGLKIYQAKTSNDDEIWMGQILETLLEYTRDAFMDVGVNIGQTLSQVKSLDLNREYYGFEPNPACNMFVEELIRINKFTNVKIFPVGLYLEDSILELDLYYDDLTNSGGSIIKNYWEFKDKKPYRTIIVPLMSLNTISKSTVINKLGIIKIDVEGAELEVLQELRPKIIKDSPIIIVEILSAYSQENLLRIERQNKILSMILDLNYKIYRIIEGEKHVLNGLQLINEFDTNYNQNLCNYILIPSKNTDLLNKFKLLK